MKKKLLYGLLALVAVLFAVYRISCSAPSEKLPENEQLLEILDEGGCLSCHSAEPQLPFYASFPIIGDVVKTDSQTGYKMFDIAPMMEALKNGGKISVVDVAKVEKAALDGDMPMAKY